MSHYTEVRSQRRSINYIRQDKTELCATTNVVCVQLNCFILPGVEEPGCQDPWLCGLPGQPLGAVQRRDGGHLRSHQGRQCRGTPQECGSRSVKLGCQGEDLENNLQASKTTDNLSQGT